MYAIRIAALEHSTRNDSFVAMAALGQNPHFHRRSAYTTLLTEQLTICAQNDDEALLLKGDLFDC